MHAGVQGWSFEHMLKLSQDAQVSQREDKQMEAIKDMLQCDFRSLIRSKLYRGKFTK